jgi:hypothetical protein
MAPGIVRAGDGIDERVGQNSLRNGKHGYVTTPGKLVK